MKRAYMIFDMQYGSTGKGLLAGYLATISQPDTVVTAWGPNAGHTYISKTGRKFVHRMLANGIVSPKLKYVLIGPGSVIDPSQLVLECLDCKDLLQNVQIIIHPRAAVVLPRHSEMEKSKVNIGSTMKGTGEAIIQRIHRNPNDSNIATDAFPQTAIDTLNAAGIRIYVSDYRYDSAIDESEVMQIEGAQGFSLSIYHGFYPYCTSRDVTPHQVLADCAIPYGARVEVMGTLRTFPIRVADRFNADGKKIGTSGPGYVDQVELDWSQLGMKPELTTVTQLPRRIFSFSQLQLVEASRLCQPDYIFLNFANYLKTEDELTALVSLINETTGSQVCWLGFGPSHNHIFGTRYSSDGGLIPDLSNVSEFFRV